MDRVTRIKKLLNCLNKHLHELEKEYYFSGKDMATPDIFHKAYMAISDAVTKDK